jgi:hypothetical protein
MKNLESYGVQKLDINEQIRIQGGFNIMEGIGYFIGATVAIALVTARLVAESLTAFVK